MKYQDNKMNAKMLIFLNLIQISFDQVSIVICGKDKQNGKVYPRHQIVSGKRIDGKYSPENVHQYWDSQSEPMESYRLRTGNPNEK